MEDGLGNCGVCICRCAEYWINLISSSRKYVICDFELLLIWR